MKSRLEEAIMGQNSARSEMMLRRRGNTPSNTPHVVGLSQFYIQGAGLCRMQQISEILTRSINCSTLQPSNVVAVSAACALYQGLYITPWLALLTFSQPPLSGLGSGGIFLVVQRSCRLGHIYLIWKTWNIHFFLKRINFKELKECILYGLSSHFYFAKNKPIFLELLSDSCSFILIFLQ